MFKNLIIYRIDPKSSIELAAIEAALAAHTFQPCTPTQEHFGIGFSIEDWP